MFSNKFNYHILEVNLLGRPVLNSDIEEQRKHLKNTFHTYINYILAIIVLGFVVTYRAVNLGFDSDFELIKLSVYIGVWFGLFTGLMIDGNAKRKLQMILVGIVVSTFASLFFSMLTILFMDGTAVWISSINILFSALGSMWVLTSYEEVIKGFDSLKKANARQTSYMKKAASHFDELNSFYQKIINTGRAPVVAEYWLVRECIQQKIETNKAV